MKEWSLFYGLSHGNLNVSPLMEVKHGLLEKNRVKPRSLFVGVWYGIKCITVITYTDANKTKKTN